MEKSFFEALGGSYTEVGEILIPDLKQNSTDTVCLSKYGRMRKHYLKDHRPVLYTNLLLSGKLFQHLDEIDELAMSAWSCSPSSWQCEKA